MLVPYTVTAIAQVDVPTDINIISGALILLFDLDDNPVVMSDDALGTNPSTGKTTGTNGQKEIWINPGTYRLNVGGDDVRITVAPGSLSVEAVGELRTNLAKASPIYAPGDTVTLASTTNTGINRLRYGNRG
jgi:cell division protein YceG involved in septum cleavage